MQSPSVLCGCRKQRWRYLQAFVLLSLTKLCHVTNAMTGSLESTATTPIMSAAYKVCISRRIVWCVILEKIQHQSKDVLEGLHEP